MKFEKADVRPFTIFETTLVSDLALVMKRANSSILFVVGNEQQFIGTITQGDLNKACASGKQTAADICNRNPVVLPANMPMQQIQKYFTYKITAIPLVDSAGRLSELVQLEPKNARTNLNIGSGGTCFKGFINLDLASDWYANIQEDFIEYNLLTDALPFDNDTVDNIYCSHLVEHIENKDVARFLQDCNPVLAPGGVLRIACPDAEFLYQVSSFDNDYWFWRREWFDLNEIGIEKKDIEQADFLVREVATPKVVTLHGQWETLCSFSNMDQDLNNLTQRLTFDVDNVGNHINYWTFDKLKKFSQKAGFNKVIRSKYQGCISQDMVGDEFDQTRPNMSVYVDCIK